MAENQRTTTNPELNLGDWLAKPLQVTQDMLASGTERWLEVARPLMPPLLNTQFSGQVLDLVDQAFDWAGQILEMQRNSTKAVLAMLQGTMETDQPAAKVKAG